MAKVTKGTMFKIGSDKVLEITDVDYDAGTRKQIDITHCESDREEFLVGLPSAPTVQLGFNWTIEGEGSREAHKSLVDGLLKSMTLTIPGSPSVDLTWQGYVTAFKFTGRQNDKFTGSLTAMSTTAVSGYPAPAA